MRKSFLIGFGIIFLLVGCGTQDQVNMNGTSNESSDSQEKQIENLNIIEITGTYEGEIDSNSIEIIGENGPIALRVLDDDKGKLEELNENEEVVVKYVENEEGQFIMVDISQ